MEHPPRAAAAASKLKVQTLGDQSLKAFHPDSDLARSHTPVHNMLSAFFMANSSSAPAAPAAASSSARCRSDSESRRRWLRMALAIVMLSSACCVSTAQGTWSTAQLSVARYYPAATSVGNAAIFAGGSTGNCSFTLFVEGLLFGLMSVGDGVTVACLRRAACCLLCLRCGRLPSDGGHCR